MICRKNGPTEKSSNYSKFAPLEGGRIGIGHQVHVEWVLVCSQGVHARSLSREVEPTGYGDMCALPSP